ncbi:MAG: hypothetical protein JNJ82_01625 [Opitutaceae bacterium]|nr:hypothetical protein [Opitutaceae bacterium]
MRLFHLPLLLALLVPFVARGQAEWRSTLYPADWTPPEDRRFETDKLIQDFSYAGYRRGEVALPAPQGPRFDVTAYGADPTGTVDSTSAIQAAIDAAAAAGGGVVYLPAGTFQVSPQGSASSALRISTSRIVLRGAGRTSTFLFNTATAMRGKAILRVEGSGSSWGTVPSGSPQPRITTDLLGPTTMIPVDSTTGFAVGDWIVIRADATDAFVAEHNMTDLWAGQGSGLGGVMFLRQITAIDGASSRLTLDAPTRYYLKTRDNARVHRAVTHLEEVGVEDLSLGNREHPEAGRPTGWGEEDYSVAGNPSYDVHGSWAVAFLRVRHAWISRVASYRPPGNTLNTHLLSNGVLLQNCRGVTVQDCEFQRPLYGGGGGNGYMYRLQASNECLLRDCIARYNRHGFVFSHMACSGNVILGGLAQVTRTQAAGSGTTSGEGCDHHMHLSQSNLIDSVQLDRDFFTAHYRGTSGTPPQHGQGGTHSVYWNLIGLAYHSTKTYIVRSEQARYGYVIGTRGAASGISTSSGAPASRTAPVDHTEGAGQGQRLHPLSLYHDQLMRRLAREQAGPPDARIVNLASRAIVGGPAANPIAGFVLQGTAAKRMLVRAVGPGLAAFGVPGTLPDPSLTLNLGGSATIENDSWNAFDAPVFAAAGAFALPAGSRDAAVVSALAPAGYTTPVGDGGGTGIVLLEVYDAETGTTGSRLVNASTRAFVGQNAGILIPGFVVQGDGVLRLLLRATGPGLVPFGVSGTLPDPQLTLFQNSLAVAANDNWGASPDASEITQVARRLGAFDLPPQSLDAALLVSVRAGTYTAHVSGVGGTTGNALVEIYLLP